jgi:tripartite-type tricarboxylate transporter receptor subunit TctC
LSENVVNVREWIREIAMKLPRRTFLHLAAGIAALPTASRLAAAQTYPTRPVRIVVGFPPGGPGDVIARLLGQWLAERLGQPFTVENRPGASGNVATETVVNAPADGYTLLSVNSSNATSATLYDKLNFNFARDIAPVANVFNVPFVMVVNPSFPARTVPEFIAYAKSHPGKINMASGGIGTPSHVGGELFKVMTGINMVHVPYRGDPPALADLMGGQVQVYLSTLPAATEYVRAGTLRALAVTAATRLETLPGIPTIDEFVPGFECSVWSGIGVPRRTPVEIVDKLSKAFIASLSDSKIKARFADLGAQPMPMNPDDFERFIGQETEKWGKVVRAASIKPE